MTLIQSIPHALVTKLFDYSTETGEFIRKETTHYRARKGDRAGYVSHGYLKVSVGGVSVSCHRLAWFYVHREWPSGLIDHIDGNPLNNRISNLRVVTAAVNNQNRKGPRPGKQYGSTRLGTAYDKTQRKWRADISIKGKNKYLGVFPTEDEAYAAYLTAKRAFHEGCTL